MLLHNVCGALAKSGRQQVPCGNDNQKSKSNDKNISNDMQEQENASGVLVVKEELLLTGYWNPVACCRLEGPLLDCCEYGLVDAVSEAAS